MPNSENVILTDKNLVSFETKVWPDSVLNFGCDSNKLTSLEGAPLEIKGFFSCQHNQLSNLIGGPQSTGRFFSCEQNKITSLIGGPTKINGHYYCQANRISSFEGIHKHFKNGYINGKLFTNGNPIIGHMLGLLLIPGLSGISHANAGPSLEEAITIINYHLLNGRDVIDCQQELIEAVLKEYAKL